MTRSRHIAGGFFVVSLAALLAIFGDAAHAGTATTAGPDESATSLTLETLTATRQRPLFSPTRHPPIVPVAPPPPPPPAPVATKPPPPSAVLVGVIIGPSTRIAMVKSGAVAKPLTLGEHQPLDGWTIETIEPDRIILAYQGDRFTLMLRSAQNRIDTRPNEPTSPSMKRWSPRRDPQNR